MPQSGALAAQRIDYLAATGDLAAARLVLTQLEQVPDAYDRHLAYFALARAYLDDGQRDEASALLANVPDTELASAQSVVDLAILQKRSHRYQDAHRAFASIASAIREDPKALHEFAQTKLRLAADTRGQVTRAQDVARRLRREAAQLLERVIQLAVDQPARAGWAWFDLARARAGLDEPDGQVLDAIERAIQLLPGEPRFARWKIDHMRVGRGNDGESGEIDGDE